MQHLSRASIRFFEISQRFFDLSIPLCYNKRDIFLIEIMPIYIYILLSLWILLSIWYVLLYIFSQKIYFFEQRLIGIFASRTDIIPGLYEISKSGLTRHSEIFSQVLTLRKKEFSLREISQAFEGFIEIEQHIHHEDRKSVV